MVVAVTGYAFEKILNMVALGSRLLSVAYKLPRWQRKQFMKQQEMLKVNSSTMVQSYARKGNHT